MDTTKRNNVSKLSQDPLFVPNVSLKREKNKSFLYIPYSNKCHRRVFCYSHANYDMWVFIETDPAIIEYNEQPLPIKVIGRNCRVVDFSPMFFTKSRDGSREIHVMATDNPSDPVNTPDPPQDELLSGVEHWANQNGFSVRVWPLDFRSERAIEMANLKQLLRYVSKPTYMPDRFVIEKIKVLLSQAKSLTVHYLVEATGDIDEDLVLTAIADLIVNRVCYSDIHLHFFHHSSQLSSFHAFE